MKSFVTISVIFALSVLIASTMLSAEEPVKVHPEKIITAMRANPDPPVIDGVLSDEIWQKAPFSGGFLQKEPKEGDAATEDTKIQIAYDDDAIYFGITCYDRQPDKITARLTRRDGQVESDWVSVNIDSHHDHQTGNWFCVNAASVLNDGQMFNDGWEDSSWNGVWEAKTSINKDGWCAEYRIPYHVLRFSKKDEYVWGVNVLRNISRKKERDFWILVRQNQNGWISRFGHIEGIKGINPPRHLEFAPFLVGRSALLAKTEEKPDLFSSVGIDMRYGITSNISLTATVNPDFGQVEADPAQLNLTAFETYFEERRPFFIEGNTIFSTPYPDIVGVNGMPQLFYSRRMGRQPGMFSIPGDSEVIDQPKATTIISAVKLSGKTEKKTAFGVVNAITANEYADIERKFKDPITGIEQVKQEKFRIEPITNYFIGRVQQDVMKKSTIGAMLTAVNRDGVTPSYAGEVDSHLKLGKKEYSMYTRLAGSQTGTINDRKSGYDALAYFYKFSGTFGGQFYLDARSPELNVNDLGFVDRANLIQSGVHLMAKIQKPWALARKSGFNINAWSSWNYDSVNLAKGINFNNWTELKNYWNFGYGFSREFEALDDMETRGGPLIVRPAHLWGWVNLGTDGRKLVSLNSNVFWKRTDDGLSRELGTGMGVDIRLASNMQFSIGPGYKIENKYAQWVKNVDDNSDGKNDHYIFGELKNRILDVTTRLNVSFTTNTSLQLYLQPFVAVGNYSDFRELARPSSYDFIPYNLDENPDFISRSLRGNMVFRWEYRPGSALFLVWSQSRSASPATDDPALRPYEDMKDAFTDSGENVFLVKLSYWLGV